MAGDTDAALQGDEAFGLFCDHATESLVDFVEEVVDLAAFAEEAALARFVLRATEPPTVEQAATGLQWAVDEVHRVIGLLSAAGAVELVGGVLRPAGSWRIQRRQPAGIWSRLADL